MTSSTPSTSRSSTAHRKHRKPTHTANVIGTLRREVLDHILTINAAHAHRVLTEYARHHNHHRPHQARDQQPPDAITWPPPTVDHNRGQVIHARVLGGLVNEYHYAA